MYSSVIFLLAALIIPHGLTDGLYNGLFKNLKRLQTLEKRPGGHGGGHGHSHGGGHGHSHGGASHGHSHAGHGHSHGDGGHTHEEGDSGECVDSSTNCDYWQGIGNCDNQYKSYMVENCKKACGLCGDDDDDAGCSIVTIAGGNVGAGTCCKLPFEYKGVSYTGCTEVESAGRPWCLTGGSKWGYCSDVVVDPCLNVNCGINAQCVNGQCQCFNGFVGNPSAYCNTVRGCIDDCTGLPSGNYQSCQGCDVYATCVNEYLVDGRVCRNTVWDDRVKECSAASTTCTSPTQSPTPTYRYIIYHNKKSWEDAARHCMSRGGSLAIIDSDAQQTLIMAAVSSGSCCNLWIGGMTNGGSAFSWVDGRLVNSGYSNWFNRQSPSTSQESCVAINLLSGFRYGQWSARTCSEENGYVCQDQINV